MSGGQSAGPAGQMQLDRNRRLVYVEVERYRRVDAVAVSLGYRDASVMAAAAVDALLACTPDEIHRVAAWLDSKQDMAPVELPIT